MACVTGGPSFVRINAIAAVMCAGAGGLRLRVETVITGLDSSLADEACPPASKTVFAMFVSRRHVKVFSAGTGRSLLRLNGTDQIQSVFCIVRKTQCHYCLAVIMQSLICASVYAFFIVFKLMLCRCHATQLFVYNSIARHYS